MGEDVFSMNDETLALFRNQKMGFVFQFHHLIQEMSALENIMLPALIAGDKKTDVAEKALTWLKFMGLEDRASHYPSQLSGGELQRVAIARALIKDPEILFADEPTGNLDHGTAQQIVEMLFELNADAKTALVLVTHDRELASRAALIAPARPIANVPTGMPAGICTIESNESIPFSACDWIGTPSTGKCVRAANMPGRWAAPPAPAISTSKPR